MKKKICLIAMLSLKIVCYSQVKVSSQYDYKKFSDFFRLTMYHPIELVKSCTPIACVLKIEVDSAKNIVKMQLSDSAEPLFVVEFEQFKYKLNKKLLETYLKSEYNTNNCSTYFIPLFYSIAHLPCSPQSIPVTTLYSYLKFNGNYLKEDVIFLEPIYSTLNWQN